MIQLRDVCAGYGEKEVLRNVGMTFIPGEITVLIGPNGCGKSTLLKTMVGIVETSAGEICLVEQGETVPIKRLSPAERAKKVAYLPQNRKAPDMSVFRMVLHGRFAHLGYPRKYRREDMCAAEEAIGWAGLEDKVDEMVSHLSGGMQQNVYLAMALAQNADTILMDEPTTYLDVVHQLKVMGMAKKLADQGKAVVMVLHDLSMAMRVADKIILMEDGRVCQIGTPEDIFLGGKLEQVFGVRIDRVETKNGWHYFFDELNVTT